MLQAKWTPRCPDLKDGQISLQRPNACSSFISQDERMSESPVETLQKALGLHLILKRGLTSLWQLESHGEITASNDDHAWQFLNIFKNHNITVSNRKWSFMSLLTSRSVRIVLRSLAEIPEVSIITRQECCRCWRYTSIEKQTRHNSRIYPRFLHNSRKSMRLPLQREMRHNSPALRAQQFHVPNTTRKEPWFAWRNFRESPRTTSHV